MGVDRCASSEPVNAGTLTSPAVVSAMPRRRAKENGCCVIPRLDRQAEKRAKGKPRGESVRKTVQKSRKSRGATGGGRRGWDPSRNGYTEVNGCLRVGPLVLSPTTRVGTARETPVSRWTDQQEERHEKDVARHRR